MQRKDQQEPQPASEDVVVRRVSVIIPTYQRRDLALRTVQALARLETDPDDYEVVVVVDGSTDGTEEALRALATPMPLTVVEQANRGRPSALNAGAAVATGDVLLFLDDDMVADPRMIEEHIRSYRELRADAVLGALAHDPASPPNLLSDEVRRWLEKDFGDSRTAHELIDPARTGFIGGQFSIRRAMFERIGGFDGAFNRGRRYGNADLDLKNRLQAAGARIAFNGGALSTHLYLHRYRAVWRMFESMGRSDVAFDRKFPERQPRKTRPLPPPRTRKGLLARGTLRHPGLAAILAKPLGRLAEPLVDRGMRDPVTKGLGYVTLTHRYWYGVTMEGGGHGLGVGGPAPTVAVLAYHRVSPPPLPRQRPWSTSPERMAAQIRAAVEDGWQPVRPDEVAAFLGGDVRIPLRSLLVTFDDGYADLAERGVPILQDLGLTALAFVVTGRIGGLAAWGEDPGPAPSPLLGADAIRVMAEQGTVEIGVHGRTHCPLPGLGVDALEAEVTGSRADLEALGLPIPRFLAYPYGEFDVRVRRAAAGFVGAFTTRDGLIGPDDDWTRLPRVEILAGLTPQALVWRLRRLSWEHVALQAAGTARRRLGRVSRRALR